MPEAKRGDQTANKDIVATSSSGLSRISLVAAALASIFIVLGCHRDTTSTTGQSPVTDIAISSTAIRTSVKRLGINLGGQNFYDSGQLLRNLIFRNPGFEGEAWQSIIRCKTVTSTSCTDGNKYDQWPADFIKGAQFEFITGNSKGIRGTVTSSTKAAATGPEAGITFYFAPTDRPPTAGDFALIRLELNAEPLNGWWGDTRNSGATFTMETKDLAPDTQGKQAMRISAAGPGQTATLSSYFDTYAHGRSFVQLHGAYKLSFRAKGAGGNNSISIAIQRLETPRGNEIILSPKTVQLSSQWKQYSYPFTASEDGSMSGPANVSFTINGANVLLDDVSLEAAAAKDNPTPFRNEVVDTLRALRPGVLRYMDSGTDFGSTLDNMIAPPFARRPMGWSLLTMKQEDIPIGLHEFLQLCQAIGAEPWYSMPAVTTPEEARNLVDYLGGPTSSIYGAKRAALGQTTPWTSVFPTIHLELGNEQWNGNSFYGATIPDPVAHGQRAADVFAGLRSSSSYASDKFDLILGSFAVVPWWTQQQLVNSANYDSAAVAPYLFDNFNDASSNEAIFGPMFAQPEMIDSVASGYMTQQLKAAHDAKRPAALSVYEVNLSTTQGSVPQSTIDAVVPSVGAGIAVADHMLLMLRDLGVNTQAVFALTEYVNGFRNQNSPGNQETVPLWGTVVDMGGSTNLRRPQFLAEQLANDAILPNMLGTTLTGANPAWEQKLSTNDKIKLEHAHDLQTFAFADGARRSLIVINLSRNEALPITISGAAPSGAVELSQLTSKNITDTNELKENVIITKTKLSGFNPKKPYLAPPFSMNVFQWEMAK